MPRETTVLRSINIPGEDRCCDLFRRSDGTFGFEEYRRDIEDGRGWFPIGFFGERVFDSEEAALRDARATVAWLNDAIIKN